MFVFFTTTVFYFSDTCENKKEGEKRNSCNGGARGGTCNRGEHLDIKMCDCWFGFSRFTVAFLSLQSSEKKKKKKKKAKEDED